MYDLKALEGELIAGRFYPIDPTTTQQVRLHKVEPYGIWIESQYITEKMLALANRTSAGQTPVIFLPWCQIGWIQHLVSVPALSDSAL